MTAAPAASLQTIEVALSANPYPVVIGEGGAAAAAAPAPAPAPIEASLHVTPALQRSQEGLPADTAIAIRSPKSLLVPSTTTASHQPARTWPDETR